MPSQADPPARTKLVVFCGAGLSVPAGIPAMAQFADRLRDLAILSPTEQHDFDRIQSVCAGMASIINVSPRNLEQLSSFLAVLNLSQPAFQFPGCSQEMTPAKALQLITKCIVGVVKPNMRQSEATRPSTLLHLCNEFDLTLVTTNYDLHIELCASQLNDIQLVPSPGVTSALLTRPQHDGLYLASVFDARGKGSKLHLFKLHGSINWYTAPQDKRTVVEHRLFLPAAGGPSNSCALGHANRPLEDMSSNDVLLVAPTVIKPDRLSIIEEQWRGAFSALCEAHQIWFIGYSFPESDSYMRYFLALAFHQNPQLRQIVVIDPDFDVQARARELFKLVQHSEIFVGLPFGWELVQFPHLAMGNYNEAVNQSYVDQLRRRQERAAVMEGRFTASSTDAEGLGTARGRGRGRGR